MTEFNFGPAFEDEAVVYGAGGPGYNTDKWVSFMKNQMIERVCCLQKERIPDLIRIYIKEFGEDNVREASIEDFHLCSLTILTQKILPFLQDSYEKRKRVVVHCAGGSGRTGHVLAAWLVFRYGFEPSDAISTVERTGRRPREAVFVGNATLYDLLALLSKCGDNGAGFPNTPQ
jgi:protein-tyrosine phosphatase